MTDEVSATSAPEALVGEVEHPEPTTKTIKELYAHAFSCAKPDCAKWLYAQSDESVEPVLNSRVAHIHARRPGGPRWKPGMTHEENRAAENLLLLCIPHSYEIDEQPERFPAEMLQQWREQQRAEHSRLRKAWPLNDEEARIVAGESFPEPSRIPLVLTDTARAAERVAIAAIASRPAAVEQAQQWRATWDRARSSVMMWDKDGERLYAEPSFAETSRHQQSMLGTLRNAIDGLAPFIADLKAEAAAAAATVPGSADWCEWLGRSADGVSDAVGRWPGPPPATDDEVLTDAVKELRAASSALSAYLRGEKPPAPPAAPEPEAEPADQENPLSLHRALLDRARPYARVQHRPYDPVLRDELVQAARDASTIPPVLDAMGIDLTATAALAAAVGRNAEAHEIEAFIPHDSAMRPLCVAVVVLFETRRILLDRGLVRLAEEAASATLAQLRSVDWSQADAWVGNERYGRLMFGMWAHLSSADEVKASLAEALKTDPDRLVEMLLSTAGWTQRESFHSNAKTYERNYRELPEWLPVDEIVTAAESVFPEVAPRADEDDTRAGEVEGILADVLHLIDASAKDA